MEREKHLLGYDFARHGLITGTGHDLAGISTKQVPRCSLACLLEAVIPLPLATDRTERYGRMAQDHRPPFPVRSRLQKTREILVHRVHSLDATPC